MVTSATSISDSTSGTAAARSRTSGALMIIGGMSAITLNAILFAIPPFGPEGVVSYPLDAQTFQVVQVVFAVTQAMILVGFVALQRSRAAGTFRLGRIGGWLTVVGWSMKVVGELVLICVASAPNDSFEADAATSFFGVGVIVADVGLILFGIATLRTKVWPVGVRWLPLGLGVYEILSTPILLGAGFASITTLILIAFTDALVVAIGVTLIRQHLR